MEITPEMIQRLDAILGTGLRADVGDGDVGQSNNFCVQSAVNRAMDLKGDQMHDDHPFCVCDTLIDIGIGMNDQLPWRNNKRRAEGLRDYAIAELGDIHNKKYLIENSPYVPYENSGAISKLISNKLKEEFKEELSKSRHPITAKTSINPGNIGVFIPLGFPDSKRIVKVMVEVCRELDTDGIRWLDEFNATEDKKAFLGKQQKKADIQNFKAKKAASEWESRYKTLFPEIFQ